MVTPGMHTLLCICMKTISTESTKWAMSLPTMSLFIIDDYSNGNKHCNFKKDVLLECSFTWIHLQIIIVRIEILYSKVKRSSKIDFLSWGY